VLNKVSKPLPLLHAYFTFSFFRIMLLCVVFRQCFAWSLHETRIYWNDVRTDRIMLHDASAETA
jgi:hypothetical protein